MFRLIRKRKDFFISVIVHATVISLIGWLVYERSSRIKPSSAIEIHLQEVHVHDFKEASAPSEEESAPLVKKSAKPAPREPVEQNRNSSQNTEAGHDHSSHTHAPPSDALNEYLAAVLRIAEQKKFYPRASRLSEESGLVVVGVTLVRSGSIQSIEIRKSSGFPRLDAAARSTIESIASFPAVPEAIAIPVTFTIPIRYELNPDH